MVTWLDWQILLYAREDLLTIFLYRIPFRLQGKLLHRDSFCSSPLCHSERRMYFIWFILPWTGEEDSLGSQQLNWLWHKQISTQHQILHYLDQVKRFLHTVNSITCWPSTATLRQPHMPWEERVAFLWVKVVSHCKKNIPELAIWIPILKLN